VDFPPTSENLSKWMFDIVQKKMSELGISVSKVTWHETPKSVSTYNNEWGT
jgi:6-pyruvoyltetrahydropterin/6-carboxytetrahydropterin synthase